MGDETTKHKRSDIHMKKSRSVKKFLIVLLNAVLIFLCVFSLLIDLTYSGYINWHFMQNALARLKGWLGYIGFRRSNALKLLQSSLGIAVTVITFVLNWGVDLFKHSERKVFGISWGELQADEIQKRGHNLKFVFMLVMPILIVGAIILELCATSYALLFYSYCLICGKYRNFAVSYDKKMQREKVVYKLIGYIDGEKDYIDDNVTAFCSTLENIREGILAVESWNSAWLLFDDFLQEIMKFDRDKCFKFSGYFFEIVFDIPSDKHVQKQLIYVKRYISQFETDNESENVVLWSLLCSVALHWDSETMDSFLGWFIDLPERSGQRILRKLGKLERSEIRQQSAEILVMLEYWMRMQERDTDIDRGFIERIYEYGKEFLQEDCEPHELFLQMLDHLYEKKYGNDGRLVYNAAKAVCNDAKYDLNNTIIMTKLKYKFGER